jgi:hypothetical protein
MNQQKYESRLIIYLTLLINTYCYHHYLIYIGSIEVMDDRSWMYRDSPQGMRMTDYCNMVQGFINYTTSIPRNISGGGIRCSCKRCKNKKKFFIQML